MTNNYEFHVITIPCCDDDHCATDFHHCSFSSYHLSLDILCITVGLGYCTLKQALINWIHLLSTLARCLSVRLRSAIQIVTRL